jgi:hypothetical protein
MAFKPQPGEKCFIHQQSVIGLCSWCSKPLCEQCVLAAGGKKYCDKCQQKFSRADSPTTGEKKYFGEKPRTPIRNVDPSFVPPSTKK